MSLDKPVEIPNLLTEMIPFYDPAQPILVLVASFTEDSKYYTVAVHKGISVCQCNGFYYRRTCSHSALALSVVSEWKLKGGAD